MDGASRSLAGFTAAAAIGALLWLATAWFTGRSEAWDASLYWQAAYPVALVVAALFGYVFPNRAWRWGLLIFMAQAAVLTLSKSDFGLLPLGLLLFGVLSVPAMLAAAVGGAVRRAQAA